MGLSAPEKLRRFYDLFSSSDHVLTLINADPDAIASAMAVSRLLWHRVASITISNINHVRRPDNLAMIRLLGVKLVYIDEIDKSQFNRIVMVDSQPPHNEAFSRFSPDVIIDHHPETVTKAAFMDIRPKFGATATIMTEYLRAAKIKPSVKLATGLFLAIKTDTSNFERQTLIEDVRAFQFLFRHTNIHLASKIEQSELTFDFLRYFKTALQNKQIRKGRVFVHLGSVVNPDICVLVADFFMKVDTVMWSIISGINDQKVIIVLRNDGIRKNAGKVAQKSFGHLGSAGGHKSMARAEILLSDLKDRIDTRDDKKLQRWIIKHIEKRADKK
jgi:nanoRNase/pAp phosphatase (c-di-AMP/oligoRNAs hydrolase)